MNASTIWSIVLLIDIDLDPLPQMQLCGPLSPRPGKPVRSVPACGGPAHRGKTTSQSEVSSSARGVAPGVGPAGRLVRDTPGSGKRPCRCAKRDQRFRAARNLEGTAGVSRLSV